MILSKIPAVFILIALCFGADLVAAQFTVYDSSSLDASLGESCVRALAATIDCSTLVSVFQQLSYRTDLDVELADSMCTAGCAVSLKSWFDNVSVQCSGKTVSGGIPTRFGGYMWAGYNEASCWCTNRV
jgi:hypothetical protein